LAGEARELGVAKEPCLTRRIAHQESALEQRAACKYAACHFREVPILLQKLPKEAGGLQLPSDRESQSCRLLRGSGGLDGGTDARHITPT